MNPLEAIVNCLKPHCWGNLYFSDIESVLADPKRQSCIELYSKGQSATSIVLRISLGGHNLVIDGIHDDGSWEAEHIFDLTDPQSLPAAQKKLAEIIDYHIKITPHYWQQSLKRLHDALVATEILT